VAGTLSRRSVLAVTCGNSVIGHEEDGVTKLYNDDGTQVKEVIWSNGPYYLDEPLNYKRDYKELNEAGFTDLAIKTMVKYEVTREEAYDLARMFEFDDEWEEIERITLKMLLAKGINFKTHRRYFKEYDFCSDNYNMEIGDPVDA
jgi:hypothetical protein